MVASWRTVGGAANTLTLTKAGCWVLTAGIQPSHGHANLAVCFWFPALRLWTSVVLLFRSLGFYLNTPRIICQVVKWLEKLTSSSSWHFFPLTVFLRLFNYLLALFAALGVGQDEPQSDRDEGSQPPQGVMRWRLDQLLCSKFLLVEHVLVLHLQKPRQRTDFVC